MLTLRSDRLLLRPLTPEDATPTYAGWLNDPEVNRFLEVRYQVHTVDTCRQFIADMNASTNHHLFGIFVAATQQHIGNIKLGFIDHRTSVAQVSLFLGEKSAWNHGYATEAIRLITSYGFKEVGLARIEAGMYDENLGSLRAFLKLGFTVEGYFRKKYILADRRIGSFWVAVLKEEWRHA